MTIRVLQVGLGPIGVGVLRQIVDRKGFELAGAVDIDPAKVGKDVGEVCGLESSLGLAVQGDLAAAVTGGGIDVAVLCTGSSLERVLPQFETVVAAGIPVVSTTEELAFPQNPAPELAARLDAAAKAGGVAVLGTGVNPGFAMDLLPLALTAPCERVDSVTVDRIQDASTPPHPLPGQDRLRHGAGGFSRQGGPRGDGPCGLYGIRRHDRRRSRLEAGPHHRRHRAQGR